MAKNCVAFSTRAEKVGFSNVKEQNCRAPKHEAATVSFRQLT
jgi:hypothetical protein